MMKPNIRNLAAISAAAICLAAGGFAAFSILGSGGAHAMQTASFEADLEGRIIVPADLYLTERERYLTQTEADDCVRSGRKNCLCVARIVGHLLYAAESMEIGEYPRMYLSGRSRLAREQAYSKCA